MAAMSNRYSRQILFSGIGKEGQQKIRSARAVLIGCGALGTVSAEMLVRAGIGSLRIIDRDFVEESNLQRQSLFVEEDAREGLPKAAAAEKALRAINSDVEIQGCIQDVTWENLDSLCRDFALVIDGTDNFETRFLINDWAVRCGVSWIYGACVASYGTAFAFRPKQTPCLRCLLEKPPELGRTETCDTAGILAPAVHVVAAFQVAQALKILVGQDPLPEMLQVDVWQGQWRTLRVTQVPDSECPCCGRGEFEFLSGREKARSTRLCGRGAVQVSPSPGTRIDFEELGRRLQKSAQVDVNSYLMRIRVDGYDIALFRDGRSIIKGTDDPVQAKAIYARYIGM